MKEYIGTKYIQAKPMTRGEYNQLRGWIVPQDENPKDEGYLMVYPDSPDRNVEGFDGYVSWSPKAEFEKSYQTENFTFGQALELAKQGKKIARKNWNTSNQFVYYIPEDNYPANLALKTTQNDIAVWTPSVSDVLSKDWYIVE